MAGYCVPSDLLVGDLLGIDDTDKQSFIDRAASEMHAYLGTRYAVPLVGKSRLPWSGNVSAHEAELLKIINAKIASGRLILQKFAADEESNQHAYGASLLREGKNDLMQIVNGTIELTSVQGADSVASEHSKVPSINNHDAESMVDAWEDRVMRGDPFAWTRPGAGPHG